MYVWIQVRSDTLNIIATVIGGLAALVTTLGHRLHAQDLLFAQGFQTRYLRIDRYRDEVSELCKLTVGSSEGVSRNEGRIDTILEQMWVAYPLALNPPEDGHTPRYRQIRTHLGPLPWSTVSEPRKAAP